MNLSKIGSIDLQKMPKNELECILSTNPSIGEIQRLNGGLKLKTVIEIMIADLANYFNLGKSMNSSQIVETAEFILEDFKNLKIEDLKLCFKNVKKGHYGVIDKSLDGCQILSWLNSYFEKRMKEAENYQIKIHSYRKKESITEDDYLGDNEQFKENWQKYIAPVIAENMEISNKNSEIQFIESEYQKNLRIINQRFINQFDNLYFKYGISNIIYIKIIKIGNKKYDMQQFLEVKYKNLEKKYKNI